MFDESILTNDQINSAKSSIKMYKSKKQSEYVSYLIHAQRNAINSLAGINNNQKGTLDLANFNDQSNMQNNQLSILTN
jgi:hypothetical protein